MKLELVFCIISGLISCSLQQGRPFRAGWFPNSFPRARQPFDYFADQDAGITEMDSRLYDMPTNDVQQGLPSSALSPFFKTWKSSNPQSRFFGFMLYNQLKNSLLFPPVSTITFTSTSTSVTTIVSTISTVSIQNCLSATGFAVPENIPQCPGRKRSIELNAVEPSKVLSMEASRIARFNYDEQDLEPYVISSSFSDLRESDVVAPRQFGGGLFPSYSKVFPSVPTSIQVVTVTSTSTSFFLIASPVKKPFTLADPGDLKCMPFGFVTC